MTEYQRANIRVSDTEREDALRKLGEHMSSGRLDIDEYGERTAKVATAKTRGDVLALFEDLPEPRPAFGQPGPPSVAATPGALAKPGRSLADTLTPIAVTVAGIAVILGLFVLLKGAAFALLPFIFIAMGSSRWHRGHGGRGPRPPYRHDWRRSAD